MTTKADNRRKALREKLIEIAERHIAENGLSAIKARDLAKEAGCSVGAIYNVFDDLQDLSIAVNGRTFHALGEHVAASLDGKADLPAADRMVIMSEAYMSFATEHPKLWRALFDLRMSNDMDVPEWYLQELGRLFGMIHGPVQECFPDFDTEQVNLMTRALFSSVHGIVLLGLENRISAVPPVHLSQMIDLLIRSATGNKPF